MDSPDQAKPDLGLERTRLAHDRTLMAWIRTATSLISFGFTIYKFTDSLPNKGQNAGSRFIDFRTFPVIMISVGIVSLAFATLQHMGEMHRLRKVYPGLPHSLATALAMLISALGIFAIVAVILRQ